MPSNGHSKLPPSGAERWMTCPGSVVLSEGMPGDESEYAEEGTRAHAYAERWLLLHFAQHGAIPTPNPANKEEIEIHKNVKVYVDECISLTTTEKAKVHVEHKVSINEDVYGTADFICWHPTSHTLYVRDLKYGAGVPVQVERNVQLRIYALAALLTMKLPARVVNIGIVQPRYDHPDGFVRSIDFDAVDLMDLYADVLDGVKRVEEAEQAEKVKNTKDWEFAFLKPSEKGCRWCLAAPKCPVIKNRAQALAKIAFGSIVSEGTILAPEKKPVYNSLELARALDFMPILEAWIKSTREFAYNEAEKGVEIPDYKLVEKQAIRKFKEGIITKDLIAALGCGPYDIFKPVELINIGDAEKMAPGKNAKERAAVLEPFVEKKSSGHTLVHNSDKRDPVRIDAKAAFAELPAPTAGGIFD
jgi:uncharacterized protein DUF2800